MDGAESPERPPDGTGFDPRQQVRNLSTNYIALLVGFASVLVLTPILVDWLGDVQYGLWVLMASVVGYLGLLDLGLRPSVVKYVAEYRATGAGEKLRSYVSTVFVVYLAAGAASVLAAGVVGTHAGRLFGLPEELHGPTRTVFIVGGAGVAVAFQNGLAGGILEGFKRYDLNNSIAIVCQALNFVGTLLLVFLGRGLVSLVVLMAVTALIGLALRLVLIKRRLDVSISPSAFRVRALRTGMSYGSWAFLLAVATQIVFQTDHIVISAVLSVGLVTVYAIAWKLVDAVNRIVFSCRSSPSSGPRTRTSRSASSSSRPSGSRWPSPSPSTSRSCSWAIGSSRPGSARGTGRATRSSWCSA
jgi:O-antigen/teichoic acid export membrane protein